MEKTEEITEEKNKAQQKKSKKRNTQTVEDRHKELTSMLAGIDLTSGADKAAVNSLYFASKEDPIFPGDPRLKILGEIKELDPKNTEEKKIIQAISKNIKLLKESDSKNIVANDSIIYNQQTTKDIVEAAKLVEAILENSMKQCLGGTGGLTQISTVASFTEHHKLNEEFDTAIDAIYKLIGKQFLAGNGEKKQIKSFFELMTKKQATKIKTKFLEGKKSEDLALELSLPLVNVKNIFSKSASDVFFSKKTKIFELLENGKDLEEISKLFTFDKELYSKHYNTLSKSFFIKKSEEIQKLQADGKTNDQISKSEKIHLSILNTFLKPLPVA